LNQIIILTPIHQILMGAERKSTFITEESKTKTAYHEAGHALVALFNPHSDPLHLVTIMPRGNALGVTWTLPKMDKYDVSYVELLAVIEKAMGGRAAEELIYGKDK
jgi:ATP-dependent metalloprotease